MSRSSTSSSSIGSAMKNAPWWAPTSGVSSDMIIRLTVSRSRCPCIIPVKRARFELSQSCSALRRVVSARLRIISLMLSLSSATSPFASTETERVMSPCVTAVETSAIARTCVVNDAAIVFTLSVRSFQTPETPFT